MTRKVISKIMEMLIAIVLSIIILRIWWKSQTRQPNRHDLSRNTVKSRWARKRIKADKQQAAAHGIQGVPFFIVGEKYGMSGAQGEATFGEALAKLWSEKHPLQMVGDDATGVCQDGACL